MHKGKKVMAAMSGGVDSSVAAALLLEQGYDVVGVTMQVWPGGDNGEKLAEGGCCSLSAVEDARRVAGSLGIPHYVLNFREAFGEKVIDYFVREYLDGRTPNPCVACNRHIKFDLLLKKALSMGMDYISTGHYALIEFDGEKGRYLLKKSRAGKKDQTYVLYNLNQMQLSRTLMPLGPFGGKDEVRNIAAELGLKVADKPDSQEICFVPGNDYGSFIEERSGGKSAPGFFVDTKGNVLGEHRGIVHYTVGQRKGLGITAGKPVYVKEIDKDGNRIILGEAEEILSNGLYAGDMNWILFEKIDSPLRVKAKIRYNAEETPAEVMPAGEDRVKVVFDYPQRAVAPGQSVVFYDGDAVVGGGVILNSIP